MRSSVVLGLGLILVTALSGSATTACLSCRDIAIHQSECSALHGTFDESTCSCAGRSPYEPYPSSVPARAVCTSDVQCRRACSEDGPCPLVATSCAYDDSCACPGSGRCTMAECTGDLDCRAGASCNVDTATCVPTCQAGAVCPGTMNLRPVRGRRGLPRRRVGIVRAGMVLRAKRGGSRWRVSVSPSCARAGRSPAVRK